MSFCSCLLVGELKLSPSHRSVSTSNVDFLNSIVGVLSSDVELLLLLSSALIPAEWEKCAKGYKSGNLYTRVTAYVKRSG